jgi:hypothetical protein
MNVKHGGYLYIISLGLASFHGIDILCSSAPGTSFHYPSESVSVDRPVVVELGLY